MKIKSKLIVPLILIIIACILVLLITIKHKFSYIPNNIVITQYKPGTNMQLKKININSDNDIKELSKYVKKLKPLKDNEMIQLALVKEVEIKYTNSISITIQLDEENYCYYTDKEQNISTLSRMPKGLYDWLQNVIIENNNINENNHNYNEKIENEIESDEDKDILKEVTIATGLHAGSKNKDRIYWENDECFVSLEFLEEVLGDDVKVVYDENENIIKAYYKGTVDKDRNTFLMIDLEKGTFKGIPKYGDEPKDEKMAVLPIMQNGNVLLPLKCILNRVRPSDSEMYYDKDLELLRLHLEDFEVDFLNDFPYDIVGNYVGNAIPSYYQVIDISKNGVIYKKDNKYGLVSYNVEEYSENKIPRGKYLGYNIDIEAIYDEIEFVGYDYNIYILKQDGKSAIYNRKDKSLSEEYDLVQKIENGDRDYKVKKNGKYGLYGVSEIIYDDIWYEQGKKTGTTTQYTQRGIYGSLNGKKVLIKELKPIILQVD